MTYFILLEISLCLNFPTPSPYSFSLLIEFNLTLNLKIQGKRERGFINPANNNDPLDPPTHRTFVQRMTLPEVVLRYYNQWQIEGNEYNKQTVVPPARATRVVVPTTI